MALPDADTLERHAVAAVLQHDGDGAQCGSATLSATPGTVLTLTLPAGTRIIRLLKPSADLIWRIDADPAALVTNGTFAAGGLALSGDVTAIIVSGATTLRLRSATASATVRYEARQ